VASATAWAQSAPAPTAPGVVAAVVERAQVTTIAAAQKVTSLTAQRGQLAQRLAQQVAAVDALKKQKASWRRDRELNSAQATANDTATKLTAIDKQLAAAQTALATARRAEVAAIDAELKAGATGARATQLQNLRAQLAPAQVAPKKIVIPDAEIDPLADPEELEKQAAALAQVEKQLEQERKTLDKQHEDLALVADLRQAHERAGELSTRDDDQPHRGASHSTSRTPEAAGATPTNDTAGSPTSGGSTGGAGGGSGSTGGGSTDTTGLGGQTFDGGKSTTSFESTAAVALGEVIDRSTIDGMLRAQRSGDPKQRAEAAAQARDAVAKRLELLKKKRAMIEARAKALRHSR
jgi:hypothetical protein